MDLHACELNGTYSGTVWFGGITASQVAFVGWHFDAE